jgi:hypothetical protein
MAQVQSASALMPATNPSLLSNPDYMQQMLQTQRTQALAQALTDQGLAPVEYDPRGRISPWQGVNKLASALLGGYEAQQAMKGQAALQSQAVQSNLQQYGAGQTPQTAPSPSQASQFALGQGAQAGSVGPTNDNARRLAAVLAPSQSAPAPGPAQAQGLPGAVAPVPANPYGISPDLMVRAQMGDPVAKVQLDNLLKNFEKTGEIKNWGYQGISGPEAKAMTLAEAAKKGFHSFAPGESWTNTFTGQGGFTPKLPEGTQPNAPFTPGSPIPSVGLVPGAPQAIQATSQAGATGTTAGTPHTITNSDGSTTTALGSDLFVPRGVQASRDVDRLAILQQERGKPTNSAADNQALDREIAKVGGRAYTGPDPTVQAGRTEQQGDMGKRWSTLTAQAGNAQKVNSYLDNISSLADKAATGQFADRLQLTNSLLAPFSQKATDAVTASNLLDKYSNQIVAQLGSGGGMSTDAARDILHSAYPNRTMNAPAIHEAVNALKAQSVMAQAKARILQPAYTSNDPVAYTKAETAFDQAADPRIFQWRAIADPVARRAFGAKIMAQDPTLAAKAKALEAMGVQ